MSWLFDRSSVEDDLFVYYELANMKLYSESLRILLHGRYGTKKPEAVGQFDHN